jgi:drug/metabolite transporter (DMT)-like permease
MLKGEEHPSKPDVEAAWPHHTLLLTFVLLWGGNFVLAEVALREMDPISFSVSRFFVGGVAMISILYLQLILGAREAAGRDHLFPRLRREDWPRLVLVSVIGATLAPWLGIEGLGLTHGARASLWLALGPVMSCGLGYVLGTERIGWPGMVGIALAALGTFALAVDGFRPAQNFWLGDVLLFFALLMAVAELHFIKPLAARYGATAMVTARTAIGGIVYIVIASPSLVDEPWLTLDAWTWIAILFGGAVGVGVGQWVKVRALKKLGPTRVVLYGNLVPLAALWLAWITIGTMPSTLEILAGFLIVLGAICVQVFDLRMRIGRRKDERSEPDDTSILEIAVRPGDG